MRVFTVQEATRTLPLVKNIVHDVLEIGKELRRIVYSRGEEADSFNEYVEKNYKLRQYINELEELGCVYKDYDFSIGIVDFPAVIHGREVFLCWRSDEERLEFYHGVHEGFAQRKSIPEELLYEDNQLSSDSIKEIS